MSEIRDIQITIDGGTETIRGEKRSDSVYYCLESPVFIGLELYGCEVEVVEVEGVLKFQRIHKESSYKTNIYAFSKEFLESDKGKKMKEKIIEVGGDWEQVMGGVIFIHLPKEKSYMLTQILKIAE